MDKQQPTVLWIDDDFSSSFPAKKARIENYRRNLKDLIKNEMGVEISIEKKSSDSNVVDRLADGDIDLLLLDLELLDPDGAPMENTGFTILGRCQKLIYTPPVIILSDYVGDSNNAKFMEELEQYQDTYLEAFSKKQDEQCAVAKYVSSILKHPPITMLLISDLHAGYISKVDSNTDSYKHDKEYQDTFLLELRRVREEIKPDYVVISGDFAWVNQKNDLNTAIRFTNKIRKALELTRKGELHFCPGNHDVDLSSDEKWNFFYNFVTAQDDIEDGFCERYNSYRRHGGLGEFHSKEDLLAVETGKDASVLFAALNSTTLEPLEGNPDQLFGTFGEIGNTQLSRLKQRIESSKHIDGQLRVAIFHHPLFAAPSGLSPKEDKPIRDQSNVCFRLAEMGFDIIIHGHTHYSCIWQHTFTPLNEIGKQIQGHTRQLSVIGVPTLSAASNEVTPGRQYLILRLGHKSLTTGKRSINLHSRIFNSATKQWEPGVELTGPDIG